MTVHDNERPRGLSKYALKNLERAKGVREPFQFVDSRRYIPPPKEAAPAPSELHEESQWVRGKVTFINWPRHSAFLVTPDGERYYLPLTAKFDSSEIKVGTEVEFVPRLNAGFTTALATRVKIVLPE